jgi:hypothetical protein
LGGRLEGEKMFKYDKHIPIKLSQADNVLLQYIMKQVKCENLRQCDLTKNRESLLKQEILLLQRQVRILEIREKKHKAEYVALEARVTALETP